MPVSTEQKRAAFRKLHDSGCFVLPNPWDVGSARALQHLGLIDRANACWESVRALSPQPCSAGKVKPFRGRDRFGGSTLAADLEE